MEIQFVFFLQKSIFKMIEIKQTFDLWDIWGIRKKKSTRFTFGQSHAKGYIQRSLDFLLSQTCFKIYYQNWYQCLSFQWPFPILLTVKLDKESQRGRGLWKFNNSLLSDEYFVLKMKDHIPMSIETFNKKNIFNNQMKWQFLKFEIRKFSIHYSISNN